MMTDNHCLKESFDPCLLDEPLPEMPSIAAAVIGPSGGSLRVTDLASPIWGTRIEIPPGALDTHALIRIEVGAHFCSFGWGPSVKILPEGLRFNCPVEVSMCFDPQKAAAAGVSPAFYCYDESDDAWMLRAESSGEPENGIAKCVLWHL